MIPVIRPPVRKGDTAWGQLGEIVRRADDIGGDVGCQRSHAEGQHRHDENDRVCETSQNVHRVPERLAVDDRGGGSDGHADERIERHGQRQAERLSGDLIALGAGVAREIRNVEAERGPKGDHAGQRRDEEFKEAARFGLAGSEGRRLGEDRTEAARRPISPDQQRQPEQDQERCFDRQQDTNGIDALVNDPQVDAPERTESRRIAGTRCQTS